MKLLKTDNPYLTKQQWKKIFIATSILVLLLYIVAMICSLCGSKYFILNYQNEQMDNIESFLTNYKIMPLLNWWFTTLEFSVVISFVLKKLPKWYYVITFYAIAMIVSATIPTTPLFFYQIYPFVFYLVIPIIEMLIDNNKSGIKPLVSWKKYVTCLLRLVVAMFVVFVLQVLIFIIKSGSLQFNSIVMNLSATFIYSLEYDIALSVILFTIVLLNDKEKGDSKSWATFQHVGSSSQTSKKQSQKSLFKKKLTKTQSKKLKLLYLKFYLTQLGAFLLLMVLPFLLGKVFEFLVMYLAFAISRYILGFNYSLHYKKETTCITVGVIVFGIISLAIPFFYVILIIAICMGVALAILLHLSYKYKSMWLFTQVSKQDKFRTNNTSC